MTDEDKHLPNNAGQKRKVQDLTNTLQNLLKPSESKDKPDNKVSDLSYVVAIDGNKVFIVKIFGDTKWLCFNPLTAQTFAEAVATATSNHINKDIQEIYITIIDTANNSAEYEKHCIKLVLKKEPIAEILANSLQKTSHSSYENDFEKELLQRFNKYIYDEIEAIYNQSTK